MGNRISEVNEKEGSALAMSTGHAYLLSPCFNWPAEASFGVQDDCISPVPYACHGAARA